LLLVSDEIHHVLIYPGHQFTPMAVAAPTVASRLISLTSPSKTFNVAGNHTGNAIISDPDLRKAFATILRACGIGPNVFGVKMAEAAYANGAEWLDTLMLYLDENRKIFSQGMNAIPGVKAMPMEATYLMWVDFSGTGMNLSEITNRVQKTAGVVPNQGPTFGTGGETHLRFNIGTQKSRVMDAVARIQGAFSDLQ
jgi:cystathionine beta-lyase